MNKLLVLDDVGLNSQKSSIAECLRCRQKESDSRSILSVDWLYCLISAKLELVALDVDAIHGRQYLLLSSLLDLLSKIEAYLALCTARLLQEEHKVRSKLDELSTKKLRTKNTVATSAQLSLAKALQKVVHDDLEGLREMREATFSTLDQIITDRANTTDMMHSLRFFGQRIQRAFPSATCRARLNTNGFQLLIYNNIQYTSQLALMMADCHQLLAEKPLKLIVRRHNDRTSSHRDSKEKQKEGMMLYDEDGGGGVLDVDAKFKQLNDAMALTIGAMNRSCSTLQELFQLKRKLGKQLMRFVKYHWK